MTRAELVERMAKDQAMREWKHTRFWNIYVPHATAALAAIEAAGVVLLPRVEDWPRAMNLAFCDALLAWERGDVELVPDGIMAPTLAASPLAKERGDHAE
jgi:hypothetical protein